jgi:hypothetical protein
VNCDGVFNVSDVVLLQEWLVSAPDITLADCNAADLCNDGILDSFDLVVMKRLLVKGY